MQRFILMWIRWSVLVGFVAFASLACNNNDNKTNDLKAIDDDDDDNPPPEGCLSRLTIEGVIDGAYPGWSTITIIIDDDLNGGNGFISGTYKNPTVDGIVEYDLGNLDAGT